VGQADVVIPGKVAAVAVVTVVVGAAVMQRAEQTLAGLGAGFDELGGLDAVRTGYAGPLVVVFFLQWQTLLVFDPCRLVRQVKVVVG
jgi:hypothetical protein